MPVRGELAKHGVSGVIVSDEPLPAGVGWEPDAKVDWFLNGSDALVALCTPDDQLDDGSIQSRQNIIDEIQRARGMSHLRNRILVLKAAAVRLPSNINPTYDRLDPDAIDAVVPVILRQLTEWGVLGRAAAEPVTLATEDAAAPDPRLILDGLELGDHDEAQHRAYQLMSGLTKQVQNEFIRRLIDLVFELEEGSDNGQLLLAVSLLEAANRLDPNLVGYDLIERLSQSREFSTRSSAATLLWDKAVAVPGDVPIDLVGRLARPANEDWYVSAPAMAATKVLVLTREEAYEILDALAASENVDDRSAVVAALEDVARERPIAVKRDLVQQLASDSDQTISERARAVLDRVGNLPDNEHNRRSNPFGL